MNALCAETVFQDGREGLRGIIARVIKGKNTGAEGIDAEAEHREARGSVRQPGIRGLKCQHVFRTFVNQSQRRQIVRYAVPLSGCEAGGVGETAQRGRLGLRQCEAQQRIRSQEFVAKVFHAVLHAHDERKALVNFRVFQSIIVQLLTNEVGASNPFLVMWKQCF